MHAGNGDISDLGERFVRCFDLAADDAGLPADPAFRAALHDYMRWAVDDVLTYSPPDTSSPTACRCRAGTGTACRPERGFRPRVRAFGRPSVPRR